MAIEQLGVRKVRDAVEKGEVAQAVLLAQDADGRVLLNEHFGTKGLDPAVKRNSEPITADTPIKVASCTKLVTAVLVVQCIERGLLTLDTKVVDLVPEFGRLQVLEGYDGDGKPRLRAPKTVATIRHLLTHTSGATYPHSSPTISRWLSEQHRPAWYDVAGTFLDKFSLPLSFDPGTSWAYGTGTDWAGRCVEAATGKTLETLVQSDINARLGITAMTFKLQAHADMRASHANLWHRDAHGKPAYWADAHFDTDATDAEGGSGLIASPAAVLAVLHSLAANDGRLIQPASFDLLATPCISPDAEAALDAVGKAWSMFHPFVGAGVRKSFAPAGLVAMQDVDSEDPRRAPRARSLYWGGMPNIFWCIDGGRAHLYAFHCWPWGDAQCFDLARQVLRDVYQS